LRINVIDEPIILTEEDFEDNEEYDFAATVVALSNVYPLNENNQIIRETRSIPYKDLDYAYYPLWNDSYWAGYSEMALRSARNSDLIAVYLDNLHLPTVMKARGFAAIPGDRIKICIAPDIDVLKTSAPDLYNGLRCVFNLIIDSKDTDGLEALSMFLRPIGDWDKSICDCDIEDAVDHFATCKELYFRQITIEDGDSFSHINFINDFDDLVKSQSCTSFLMFEYPSSMPKEMIMTTEAIWTTLLLDREDNVLTSTAYSEDGKCRIKLLTGESELLIA